MRSDYTDRSISEWSNEDRAFLDGLLMTIRSTLFGPKAAGQDSESEAASLVNNDEQVYAFLWLFLLFFKEQGRDCVNAYFPKDPVFAEIAKAPSSLSLDDILSGAMQRFGIANVDHSTLPNSYMLPDKTQLQLLGKDELKFNAAKQRQLCSSLVLGSSLLAFGAGIAAMTLLGLNFSGDAELAFYLFSGLATLYSGVVLLESLDEQRNLIEKRRCVGTPSLREQGLFKAVNTYRESSFAVQQGYAKKTKDGGVEPSGSKTPSKLMKALDLVSDSDYRPRSYMMRPGA